MGRRGHGTQWDSACQHTMGSSRRRSQATRAREGEKWKANSGGVWLLALGGREQNCPFGIRHGGNGGGGVTKKEATQLFFNGQILPILIPFLCRCLRV